LYTKDNKKGKLYHFDENGNFKYMTYIDAEKPDMQYILYANGEYDSVELQDGKQTGLAHFKGDTLQYTKGYEWDDNGNIAYTITQYTENAEPPEYRNTQVTTTASGDTYVYKLDENGEYKLDKMKVCDSVPVLNERPNQVRLKVSRII